MPWHCLLWMLHYCSLQPSLSLIRDRASWCRHYLGQLLATIASIPHFHCIINYRLFSQTSLNRCSSCHIQLSRISWNLLVLFHTINVVFFINGPIISNLQNLLPSLQFRKEITFSPSARSWICAISEKVVQHTAKKQGPIISDKALICALLPQQPNDCWFLELELSAGSDMLNTNYHWSWCVLCTGQMLGR